MQEQADASEASWVAVQAKVDQLRASVVDDQTRRHQAAGRLRELTLAKAEGAPRQAKELALQLHHGRLQVEQEIERSIEQEVAVDLTDKVLEAAFKVADELQRSAAAEVAEALNSEVTDLGRRFGITGLQHVEVELTTARMKVIIAGQQGSFSSSSAGERLRLKLALTVALFRIGERTGVGRHPGLLLIDSPATQEAVDRDVAEILRDIQAVCDELPGLQIITTSADPETGVSGPSSGPPHHGAEGHFGLVSLRDVIDAHLDAAGPESELTLDILGGEEHVLGLGAWNIELEVTGQVVGSLVRAWSSLEHPEEAERFIGDIFDVSHPQALHAAIDNLFRGDQAALERLGPVVAERLRNRLEQRGTPADAYIAAISAEGLVRLAINGAWSRLQVAAVMASVSDSEEPLFATSAARLIAVLYDHLPEPELVAALHRLLSVEDASSDAAYALGAGVPARRPRECSAGCCATGHSRSRRLVRASRAG